MTFKPAVSEAEGRCECVRVRVWSIVALWPWARQLTLHQPLQQRYLICLCVFVCDSEEKWRRYSRGSDQKHQPQTLRSHFPPQGSHESGSRSVPLRHPIRARLRGVQLCWSYRQRWGFKKNTWLFCLIVISIVLVFPFVFSDLIFDTSALVDSFYWKVPKALEVNTRLLLYVVS